MEIKCFSNAHTSLSSNEIVVLDTSMVIALSNPKDNNSSHALSFASEAGLASSILITTAKQYEELHIKLTNTLAGTGDKKDNLIKNPDLGEKIGSAVEYLYYLMSMNDGFISEPIGTIDIKVLNRAHQLLTNYNVEWGDAITFAIAEQQSISNIASCDYDYTRIKDSAVVQKVYLPEYHYKRYQLENP